MSARPCAGGNGRQPARRAPPDHGGHATRTCEGGSGGTQEDAATLAPIPAKLEKAEQVLEQARVDHESAIAAIRQREKDLQQQRRDLERRHETDTARLEAAVERARESFGARSSEVAHVILPALNPVLP